MASIAVPVLFAVLIPHISIFQKETTDQVELVPTDLDDGFHRRPRSYPSWFLSWPRTNKAGNKFVPGL